MGMLSCFAAFSLAHHFIVYFCSWTSGCKKLFTRYAIIGDDICIANQNLSDIYIQVMTHTLGVQIS